MLDLDQCKRDIGAVKTKMEGFAGRMTTASSSLRSFMADRGPLSLSIQSSAVISSLELVCPNEEMIGWVKELDELFTKAQLLSSQIAEMQGNR